jgi:hypothetical protein
MNYHALTLGKSTLRPEGTYTESDLAEVQCPIRAVYILYAGQECLYVGQSGHLRARLDQHRRDKTFDRVECYLVEDLNDRLRLEGVLILSLRPLLNKGVNLGVRPNRCWELKYAWSKPASAAGAKRRRNAKKPASLKSSKKKLKKKAK